MMFTADLMESRRARRARWVGAALFVLVVLFFPRGLLGFIGRKREA